MERLLVIHGWGSNSDRWQKVKEILERKGLEVFVPDLPGFGKAPPPNEAWGQEEYKKWILDLIEKKGWKTFHLLGHSFGGALGVKIASSSSDKIRSLILVAPAIFRKKPKGIRIRLAAFTSQMGKRILSFFLLKRLYPFFRRFVYKIAGSHDYALATGVMKEVLIKTLKEDTAFYLEKITTPTLILWGKKDDMVDAGDAFLIKEKIKNSKIIIFPRAKHSLHQEVPQELSEALANFLISRT